jgi:hypothetical protein
MTADVFLRIAQPSPPAAVENAEQASQKQHGTTLFRHGHRISLRAILTLQAAWALPHHHEQLCEKY